MEFTDHMIKKYGVDKLMHNAYGGWFVAICGLIHIWAALGGFIALLCASMYKERKLDDARDPKDTAAACVGGIISLIFSFLFC